MSHLIERLRQAALTKRLGQVECARHPEFHDPEVLPCIFCGAAL